VPLRILDRLFTIDYQSADWFSRLSMVLLLGSPNEHHPCGRIRSMACLAATIWYAGCKPRLSHRGSYRPTVRPSFLALPATVAS